MIIKKRLFTDFLKLSNMKSKMAVLPLMLMIIFSCAKGNNAQVDGCIEDGIGIETAETLSDSLVLLVTNLDPETTYYSDFQPPKDDFLLKIYADRDNNAYHETYSSPMDSEKTKARLEWSSMLRRNGLIEYEDQDTRFLHYYFAGIVEGSKIYADKMLWGREAGEDLGDMFAIPFYYTDVIVTYPEFYILYGREDKHPETFREFFSDTTALCSPVITVLTFAEIPPEEFDTVTFTVEIPVDVEYYEDYSPEMYEMHPTLKPEGRRLLKGSVTVNFAE